MTLFGWGAPSRPAPAAPAPAQPQTGTAWYNQYGIAPGVIPTMDEINTANQTRSRINADGMAGADAFTHKLASEYNPNETDPRWIEMYAPKTQAEADARWAQAEPAFQGAILAGQQEYQDTVSNMGMNTTLQQGAYNGQVGGTAPGGVINQQAPANYDPSNPWGFIGSSPWSNPTRLPGGFGGPQQANGGSTAPMNGSGQGFGGPFSFKNPWAPA